jgi:AAA+ ATPase superfamily predicted ATPase
MPHFIGRKEELETLSALLQKKSASLVVMKGRRRIGKSRLIEEFAKQHASEVFYSFSGVLPAKETSAQSQRDEFASQLAKQGFPKIKAEDWNDLFWLLADKVKHGRVIILFDEISWMGSKDFDFLGKLKNAWDLYFKKNDKLILILCGSVSAWIEKNILSSTGFVGRVSLDMTLKELPLSDCDKFWGRRAKQASAYEKLKILSVTGGVPLYLEHIDPARSAEENIKSLCFVPHGILFEEFEKIFSDLFSKRSEKYKNIVRCLSNRPAQQEEICQCLGLKQSGDITEYLDDLIKAGFIVRDHTWRISDGRISTLSQYRLCDNYSRFYIKNIYGNRLKIENKQFAAASLANLSGWNILMGLQFENLVLNNRHLLWRILKIQPEDIICDNPYFQRKTERYAGCQIDYLIQAKYNTLYICEIKFSKDEIKRDVIHEVQEKISALAMPKNFSYRPILIHVNGVKEEVIDKEFFAAIIDFGQFLKGAE